MNPWHDVEPGKNTPELVECIIEIPRSSRLKYELDKDSGLLRLDRVLYSAVFYPHNYGFIPRTYCDDHDPLDILVLGQEAVVPLCILTARPIGVMQMVDQNEEDDKIIAIHEHDPAVAHLRDINQLPAHTLNELQRFFEDYKALENKVVRIERFRGCAAAHDIIEKSLQLYTDSFHADGSKRDDAPMLKSDMLREKSQRTPSRNARLDAARRHAAHNLANESVAPSEPSADSPETVTFDLRTLQTHAPRDSSDAASQDSEPQVLAESSDSCSDVSASADAARSAPALLGLMDIAPDSASQATDASPVIAQDTLNAVQKAKQAAQDANTTLDSSGRGAAG
jgi:inorganic pyrophosphatase